MGRINFEGGTNNGGMSEGGVKRVKRNIRLYINMKKRERNLQMAGSCD